MDPAAVYRDLREGYGSPARLGLFAAGLAAATTLLVLLLLAPSMDGLVGLPGHLIGKPGEQTAPVVREPVLTAAQRAVGRRNAVRVARREIGVHEWPAGDNRGARIVTYRRAVAGSGENPRSAEPWCADFVSWAWKRAGIPIGFGGRGSDYVPSLVAWAKLSHRWRKVRSGYRPRPGDLVVYTEHGQRFQHIGMVARVGHGRIVTVEGNYGNRVAQRSIKPWDASVDGFIAPV